LLADKRKDKFFFGEWSNAASKECTIYETDVCHMNVRNCDVSANKE